MASHRYHPRRRQPQPAQPVPALPHRRRRPQPAIDLALKRFEHAGNMTDATAPLAALVQSDAPGAPRRWKAFHHATGRRRWCSTSGSSCRPAPGAGRTPPDTLAQVQALMDNPAFSLSNPNKVYALLGGGYFKSNAAEFHRADGAGYAFWAEQVIALDRNNPRSSRMARALEAGAGSPDQARIRPALERWLPPKASRPTSPRSSARRLG